MRWVELAFSLPAGDAELFCDRLVEAGAAGVEERDASTFAKPPPGQVTLVVWVAPEEADGFLARVAQAGAAPPALRRDRDEDEWRDAWKQHFKPRRVGRFVLVPSWERYAPAADEIVLDLDPGRAFGTGGHASTRLCLEALSDPALPPPGRVLDVGCGSGVLAIAALKRWPEAGGAGVDIDPDALEVSRENAARNQVAGRLHFSTAAVEAVDGTFDLVLANIQAEVLIPLAAALARRLAPSGRLYLSGILASAAAPVAAAYRAAGLAPAGERDEDEWRLLAFARPR